MKTERPRTVLAGRYVLEEELGRSGVGMAWRATDTVLDRHVVVKLVWPALSEGPGFAERFARETRAVALLSHPGLVRLLDVGTEDGIAFLVREHVAGESARSWTDRGGPRSPLEAAAVVASVLDALGQAHRAGVLHLALTPENVFFAADGSVRVTDVGVTHAVMGSRGAEEIASPPEAGPLAPEQLGGEAVDARTDVWAGGALLYELLTGGPPPAGAVSARSVRRDVPRELDAALRRALSPKPDGRFPTADSFAKALRTIAGAEADQAPGAWRSEGGDRPRGTGGPPAPRRPSIFRTWLAVPLLVAVVAALALVAGLSLGELEIGGPVGIRLKHEETIPSPVARPLAFKSISASDPFGDGVENDSNIALAADGSGATVWRSENYFDGRLHKPGVGLLFDLGSRRTVTGFRLQTPWPGFAFRVAVGDDPGVLENETGPTITATSDMHSAIQPTAGRYVLLWFASVVPTDDGNRVEVAEFRMLGF